jgi:hypothetical protein
MRDIKTSHGEYIFQNGPLDTQPKVIQTDDSDPFRFADME